MSTIIWNLNVDEWEQFKIVDKVPEGQSGTWRVLHFETDGLDLEALKHTATGRNPGVGRFACLQYLDASGRWLPMMSDTRAEILEHYKAIDKMSWEIPGTRVLIFGLGLGVVLNAALSFDHVTHVDVVELSEDVIKLVGPTYASDPRVTIHHGDAFTYKWPRGTKWDIVWYDIWPSISSSNLPEMTQLMRKYQNRTKWHGAWAQTECRALRRRENMTVEELIAEDWRIFERLNGREVTKAVKKYFAQMENQHAEASASAQAQEAYA